MNFSLYIHIPFCEHRCHYCDFNTYAGMKDSIPEYITALMEEVRIVFGKSAHFPIHTVYFGGGTPSLISLEAYQNLFSSIAESCTLTENCEITLEANPGTLTYDYLKGLRKIGFNRISIGIQSTDPFDLVRLDRIHDIDDILKSVSFARRAGFQNISLDMIFGLPWQNLSSWRDSLARAIDLHPEHFSLYSLIIEPDTQLFDWYQHGLIKLQDQDLEGDMYELAMELLDKAGYSHYEISNWAKNDPVRDYRCKHNMQYWLNQPYFGIGAGAHGYVARVRTVNVKKISPYIKRLSNSSQELFVFPGSPAATGINTVDLKTQMQDFMMLGLRLVEEGVTDKRFKAVYGISIMEVFAEEVQSLVEKGLLEWVGNGEAQLRLTGRGVMVGNQVFMAFV